MNLSLILLLYFPHFFYLQRHGGWTWGGGNLSSMSASVSTLGDSGWLIHVQSVLAGSAWIAARVDLEKASVLVHCRWKGFQVKSSYDDWLRYPFASFRNKEVLLCSSILWILFSFYLESHPDAIVCWKLLSACFRWVCGIYTPNLFRFLPKLLSALDFLNIIFNV